MKKIYFTIVLLFLFQNINAIQIQDIVITNLNVSDINIHTKVSDGYYFEYYNYNYSIANNTITLNICYSPFFTPVVTTKENDFVIPNINIDTNNYILIVNVYKRMYINNTWLCNSQIDMDTITLPFTTPLNGIVTLSSDSFNENKNKILIYPNPSTGIINFNKIASINQIEVFDNLGRKVKTFNTNLNDFIKLSDLENGVYFITFYSENNITTKKVVLKK